jgi:hypothetical protein
MKKQTINKIIAYFNENESVFNSCIEELDSYDGYLGDSRYYNMEMLDEFYHGVNAIEILQRAFFGYDKDSYIIDSFGNKTYSAFNPNREYFSFNGYGNLISSDLLDYSAFIDEYAVKALSDNRRWIDAIEDDEKLSALFDELQEEESEQ